MPFSRYDLSHVSPKLHHRPWSAKWAAHPGALAALNGTGAVFLFRKTISLNAKPERFVIHVSADQRYRLYVNGQSVCFGPARGDLMHWRYETIDIAPYLASGENIVAARVHFLAGENPPGAQVTSGFPTLLVQGDTDSEAEANTPNGWRVVADESYSFTTEHAKSLRAYAVVGPSEIFDGARHPSGWNRGGFDDTGWADAKSLKSAAPFGTENAETYWWLVPRTVPLMEETPVALGVVRSVMGAEEMTGKQAMVIPANRTVTLLFDHGANTCGFPVLRVMGGAGSTLTLAYAEALQARDSAPNAFAKGDRDEIAGKVLRGYVDTWKPTDSPEPQTLDTLWWRTFRYAELTVTTADATLTLDSLSVVYTGYPWERTATFDAPEVPELSRIREVGWRTLRLCSHETFMDCPYYEQLQYAGDTRIQALASLYETGDPRLFRNALTQFDDSRAASGLTMSRYPAWVPQVITPFSLWWICMVHDYRRHVPDSSAFVGSMLPGVRSVLGWFTDRLGDDGVLGPLSDWNFVDWCDEWGMGVPPGAREGGSAIITLQLVLALQAAAELFVVSDPHTADTYRQRAQNTLAAVRERCLDRAAMLVADTPEKTSFSQHGNLLAILAGMGETEAETQLLMARTLDTPMLTQATFYFRFYLGRALVASGQGDQYLDHLQPWHDMLALGLTTWAEKPEPTRSDCHAWSSSPNYEFFATVLGINPGNDGWETTRITPHLGTLTTATGSVPIPGGGGTVTASYVRDGDALQAEITLPETGPGSTGTITWGGETRDLSPGMQTVVF